VKDAREMASLIETVLLGYVGEAAIANAGDLVVYDSRKVLGSGAPYDEQQ
jgi:hypothetical protein